MVPSPETVARSTPIQERTYLKLLAKGGTPPHSQAAATGFRYRLPRRKDDGWTPGAWTPLVRQIVPCRSGYHLIRLDHLPRWVSIYGEAVKLYLAEPGDTLIEHGFDSSQPKIVTDRVRLLASVDEWGVTPWRAWAADCAEHVLRIYERRYPNDTRPRAAIEAARAYARNEITVEHLQEARFAATSAADAATSAAYAAYAAYAAAYAATSAAYAAYAAAYATSAACAACAADVQAQRAERRWQAQRLAELLGLPWESIEGAS